ncbi:MAG TPA: DUF87 domain-containing protein [Candidatus Dormibacteraeota bacterium]|nr:DUF87 domain-containing protein [Candidatus Dormibacteraeota bacterium]
MEGILGPILQLLGIILFQLYGWVIIVAVLAYLIWQNRRRVEWISQTDNVLLMIEVPKDNDKKELSAEQMFASLHGILRPKTELRKEGSLQEHISCEIASIENKIHFYVWTPKHLKDFVEGQIYAQYPNVRIREGIEDYAAGQPGERVVHSTELTLTRDEVLPIKTFVSFEVDPLAGITAVLAKLDQPGEEMWVQVLSRPEDDSWQNKGMNYIEQVKSGNMQLKSELIGHLIQLPVYILSNFFKALFEPPQQAGEKGGKSESLSTGQQAAVKAVEAKVAKLGYQVKVRIVYLGPTPELAKQRIQAIVGGFKQFNTTNLNGFTPKRTTFDHDILKEYRARLFLDAGYTLNIEELASLYHLPHTSVETPNMVWTTTKTAEPPSNLPTLENTDAEDLSLFGETNFRGHNTRFGFKRIDRGRHLYIVGQTGTGKSKLLNLLSLSDIYHGQGMAIVDPHGDFATDMMEFIPENRLDDVIYFNPADREFPIAFNPLEVSDPAFKNHISSEMVGVLKRMFDSWGPRLEYILRYTILALLDYPDSTMLGITRMLTEKEFRKKVIKEIQDPVVKSFWVNEFASWNDKFANEAVAPVLNKVGAFTANPLVRNIIGQPKSSIDLRKVMDDGKILIVNLSRGMVGEDNAAILGALMVTKIQLAAMGRANVSLGERRPFYLYVDEFQNFATDSFAVILSEARKYGLNLTVANQYISQMPETVRDAVFGNVGSMVTFRVGAEDGSVMGKYFEPIFEPGDLVKLHNQEIFISMSIDGEKALPFSAKTIMMPQPENDLSARIIDSSRQRFASGREEIEKAIVEWSNGGQEAGASDAAKTKSADEQKPNFIRNLKNPERRHGSGNQSRSGHDRNRNRPNRPHQNASQNGHQGQQKRTEEKPGAAPKSVNHRNFVVSGATREQAIGQGEEVSLRHDKD